MFMDFNNIVPGLVDSSEGSPTFGHANANFSVFLIVKGMNF